MRTTGQCEIRNSLFRTPVHGDFLRAQNMVRVIEGKIVYKGSEGKQREVRVIEGKNYSKCMTEIQGKSILVRVSARF